MTEQNRYALQYFMDSKGLKMSPWCKAAEIAESTLRNYLKGSSNTLTVDKLSKLGKAANAVIELQNGILKITDNSDLIPKNLKLVKVRGYVQAGDWREASEYPPEEMDDIFLKEINLYQNVFGLDVRGDSMNEKFKEGDTLVCVSIYDWGKGPVSGQYVIAEATCVAGMKESTVKRYETDKNGHHWLIPDSTNPGYQNIRIPNGDTEALILNGRQIESVEVRAVVISRVENLI